jgi:hypothetical protein
MESFQKLNAFGSLLLNIHILIIPQFLSGQIVAGGLHECVLSFYLITLMIIDLLAYSDNPSGIPTQCYDCMNYFSNRFSAWVMRIAMRTAKRNSSSSKVVLCFVLLYSLKKFNMFKRMNCMQYLRHLVVSTVMDNVR